MIVSENFAIIYASARSHQVNLISWDTILSACEREHAPITDDLIYPVKFSSGI